MKNVQMAVQPVLVMPIIVKVVLVVILYIMVLTDVQLLVMLAGVNLEALAINAMLMDA